MNSLICIGSGNDYHCYLNLTPDMAMLEYVKDTEIFSVIDLLDLLNNGKLSITTEKFEHKFRITVHPLRNELILI
jgi:hypothetical protein